MADKQFAAKFLETVKKNLVFNGLVIAFWLVLGWLRSYGITSLILFPFNFLSGALIGVEEGAVWQGILGKTVMLLLLNSLIRPFLLGTGNKKEKWRRAVSELKGKSLLKIPHYRGISQLMEADAVKRSWSLIGVGTAFLVYPVITAGGSFRNAGVCLLASVALFRGLKNNRGLILAVLNDGLRKLNKKQINKDLANRLVFGNALGFAATVVFSMTGWRLQVAYVIGFILLAYGTATMLLKNRRLFPKLVRMLSLAVLFLSTSVNVVAASGELLYEEGLHSIEDFEEIMDRDSRLTEVLLDAGAGSVVLSGEGLNDDGTLTLESGTEKDFRIETREGDNLTPMLWKPAPAYEQQFIELNGQNYYIDEILEEALVIQEFALNKEEDLGTFTFQGTYIIKPHISDELIAAAEATQNFDQILALEAAWEKMEVAAEGEVKRTLYHFLYDEDAVHLGFVLSSDAEELTFVVNGEEITKKLATINDEYDEASYGEFYEIDVGVKILKGFFEKAASVAGPEEVALVAFVSFALATSASGVIGSFGGASGSPSASSVETAPEPEEAEEAEHYEMVVNNGEWLPPLCCAEKASVVFPVRIEGGEGLLWSFHVAAYPVKPDVFIPGIVNYGFDSTAQLSVQLTGKPLKTDSITVILHIRAVAKENGEVIGKANATMEAALYNLGLMVEMKDEAGGLVQENLVVTEVSSAKIKGLAELKKLTGSDYEIDENDGKTLRKK